MARFVPQPAHCAAPSHFVNGGIIATLIDCHCICTATAEAYRLENRDIGSTPHLHFVTARMVVDYLRPAPIEGPLMLTAAISSQLSKGFVVGCKLEVSGRLCATAEVTAIRVGEAWMHDKRTQEEQ